MVRHERAPPSGHRFVKVSVVIEVRSRVPVVSGVSCRGVLPLLAILGPWVVLGVISLWLAI